MFSNFVMTFIPLFVAFDAIGVLPIYMSLTEEMEASARSRILRESIITASVLTILFLLIGKGVFIILGITISDFQIAGGLILLIIAITDIVFSEQRSRRPQLSVGTVPIGTPLIAGPASLTTIIMLSDIFGIPMTLFSLIVNIVIIWLIFSFSGRIISFLGEGGARAASKVVSLFLAAIAVMIIRKGLEGTLKVY
ncbi:MAG: MarC family protein [Nitrospirae bacterium]|nr:MarC family protein [Nitrospirota bacterium]